MTGRTTVIGALCLSLGLIWIIESGAADVFLEATRPDFQKIPLGVAGIQNFGGTESLEAQVKLGSRIEEVLKADVRRSLVFSLVWGRILIHRSSRRRNAESPSSYGARPG